jgi:hypothetical protein
MTGRVAARIIAALLFTGCAVALDGPPPPRHRAPPVVVVRQPPPPPVVVVQPPPPAGHVPPGQIRSAEVHERNAARKAAHDADKARKHGRPGHDDDDDDDDDHGHGHGHGHH